MSNEHQNKSPNEKREVLVKELLQSCVNSYSDADAAFKNLDSKAQNTVAIAGVFLGGAFAFFNGGAFDKFIRLGGTLATVILGIAVLLLITSIWFCIRALRIRFVPINDITISHQEVDEILERPDTEIIQRYENYLRGQIGIWIGLADGFNQTNLGKAKEVSKGQLCLAYAVFFASLLLLIIFISARLKSMV
ncbi:MAG: hypothetical protein HYR56_18925 [Acidobacteria bacterium]|nr:hypothetical protein [Acidobacteriota bacterium]MBI3427232.1 hypothetical protein [Acidobacteriota bacterium]